MKALQVPAYGAPHLLAVQDIPEPAEPAADELLVDVVAGSLNAADLHVVHGDPFPIRLALGLKKPGITALGADVAGRVRAMGSAVTGFKPGDAVMADLSACGFGALAERVRAPAHLFVPVPARLTLVEAAAVPMAGMTALKGLRDVARVQRGERVLVLGASGGVGTFAVQVARVLGAEVVASCGAAKADLVRAMGAAEVLDGSTVDVMLDAHTRDGTFDVVFDCAAFRSPFRFRNLLRNGGRYVHVGGAFGPLLETAFMGGLRGMVDGRRYLLMFQKSEGPLLREVCELLEKHDVHPRVDQVFALEDVPAAIRHLEERRACGKVVIRVASGAGAA